MSDFESNFFDPKGFNTEQDEKKILQPLIYLSKLPHENFPKAFVNALNIWYQIPEDKVESIGSLIQYYSDSICILDDIVDSSEIRRYHPTAHRVFGIPTTLHAFYYGILVVQSKCEKLHPKASKILFEEIMRWNYGVGLETYYRENDICPSEEKYAEYANIKFFGYASIAFRWMELFSKNKIDYTKFLNLISEYFILKDDYFNLFNKKYNKYHGFASDITEGKITRPIIHAINQNPEDNFISMVFKQRTKDPDLKMMVLKKLEDCGSKKYMEDKIKNLDELIRIELKNFKENPEMEKVLELSLF